MAPSGGGSGLYVPVIPPAERRRLRVPLGGGIEFKLRLLLQAAAALFSVRAHGADEFLVSAGASGGAPFVARLATVCYPGQPAVQDPVWFFGSDGPGPGRPGRPGFPAPLSTYDFIDLNDYPNLTPEFNLNNMRGAVKCAEYVPDLTEKWWLLPLAQKQPRCQTAVWNAATFLPLLSALCMLFAHFYARRFPPAWKGRFGARLALLLLLACDTAVAVIARRAAIAALDFFEPMLLLFDSGGTWLRLGRSLEALYIGGVIAVVNLALSFYALAPHLQFMATELLKPLPPAHADGATGENKPGGGGATGGKSFSAGAG